MNETHKLSLIEILIMAAIICLIGVFAIIAVNSARSKQRDATRLSNIRQVQTALEDYFNETNTYPSGDAMPLGDAAVSACLGTGGFKSDCAGDGGTLLRYTPRTVDGGLKGLVTCGTPTRNAFCYSVINNGESYVLNFELENSFTPIGLLKGRNCAVPGKIQSGACQ